MIKDVLIFVPHPDDEINLVGGLFDEFHKNKIHTTVVITTNGDYNPKYTAKRIQEARKVQRIFQYEELYFLGYGDGYKGVHIVDLKEGEVAVSQSGHNQTYCVGFEQDYCYLTTGLHHPYTRQNYKNDIKRVILDKKADLIICVDKDSHPDHQCLSQLFDESMREIQVVIKDYRPVVLKGFAYMGAWKGLPDFFSPILQPIQPCNDNRTLRMDACLPYKWEDRVRLKNAPSATTQNPFKNKIFKALRAYSTQCRYISANDCAIAKFPRVANPETCLWVFCCGNELGIEEALKPLCFYDLLEQKNQSKWIRMLLSILFDLYIQCLLFRNKIMFKIHP